MVEVRDLTKLYRGIPAVVNLNFSLRPGEICGYLGPNGSGKTTTIKMLTGLMQPSSGKILFRGEPVSVNPIEYKRRIGYVPEEPSLYPYLTGLEYLELAGELRSLPRKALMRKAREFLRLFSLDADRHSPLSAYSKGMRQKILLSAALLHDPEIVILDEPFSGLDVSSTLVLKRLIRLLAAEGKYVLYSSHVLEVVERVCSRVVILYQGRITADDSVSRLRELMALPSLEQVFSQLAVEQDSDAVARGLLEAMRL